MAEWLRIRLPMQGTRVQPLVQEDPTCRRATKPTRHNYWACALEPASHNYWTRVPQLLKPARLDPMLCNKRSHRNEKPAHLNEEYFPLAATTESPRVGGAVVESLPANAGDTGSSSGLGSSHMPRSNKAREPQLLSLRIWSLCSATREATTVRGPRTAMKSGPHLPQLEKACAQKWRPNTAKNK